MKLFSENSRQIIGLTKHGAWCWGTVSRTNDRISSWWCIICDEARWYDKTSQCSLSNKIGRSICDCYLHNVLYETNCSACAVFLMLFHILTWVCFTTQRFGFAELRQQRHFLSAKKKKKNKKKGCWCSQMVRKLMLFRKLMLLSNPRILLYICC